MLKRLAILCLTCLLGLGMGSSLLPHPLPQNNAIAATVSSEVETAVDEFLSNIPRGYYAVKEVDELEKMVQKQDAQLIDVREPLEYARGHILNAINIPLRDLAKRQDKIATDRPVIVYCTVGYRTAIALATLHLLGYDNVLGYPASVKGWKAAGKSLE
ncbi:Rhodanese domain protein [Halothece sp. PCC 7418]|uniref:rhodanese-like domain-containing protein n=1 Tax=Halothece sp. (strain PCC 7418) TaxID=65093 RepID=UPI0002A0641E|nr:rhodanese-like domain-containing protein [Halothece sp. PCC 7418]AFZ43028.1 Rhodanese domain protein [Halothece sp. PCC 7418]